MAIRNDKFDSFLKRTLDEKIYAQVKACDSCIVTSQRDKHAFRFVFVTKEAIYLTDNPPKSILYQVSFKDVKEIKAVHDTATFLQKDLQKITQHILVRYTPPDSPPTQVFKSLFSLRKSPKLNSNQNNNNSQSWPSFGEINLNGSTSSLMEGSSTLNQSSLTSNSSSFTSNSLNHDRVDDGSSLNDLHLYILNDSSIILMILKSAWKSCLLNLTTERDLVSANKNLSYDVTRALFCDLKADIVQSFGDENSLEDLYKYLYELKTISEEDFRISEMFWKDPELFQTIAKILIKFQQEEDLRQKADQLECMDLCCQVLFILFEGNSVNIQAYSSTFLKSFVSSLIKIPTTRNIEMEALGFNFSVSAADVIYQLICFTEQVSWGQYQSSFTQEILFSAIKEHSDSCLFLDNLVSHSVQIWNLKNSLTSPSSHTSLTTLSSHNSLTSPSFHNSLTPPSSHNSLISPSSHNSLISPSFHNFLISDDAVKLYRNFVVMHQCMLRSERINHHASASYKEEFRYYIRVESLSSKIPQRFPASNLIRNIIKTVSSIVLKQ